MRAATATVAAALAFGAALSGCGGLGGSEHPPGSSTASTAKATRSPAQATRSSALATAQATHEYPSPPPPAQTVPDAAPTAVAAIRAFASQYINWQADTVAAQMWALAAHSVGQARSEMQLAAAHTAGDYELQRGGIANSGTVEAIAPLRAHRGQYVVVTREQTTATGTTAYQGLRPAWHLALATVVQLKPGQWAVSRWQPES
jgi:hypothetical protein